MMDIELEDMLHILYVKVWAAGEGYEHCLS